MAENPKTDNWFVYIIRATDQSLYTGITTDVERRYQEHCRGTGAKFFRGRSPEALVFVEAEHSRGSASQREAAIKKLTREQKLRLIAEASSKAPSNGLVEQPPQQ